jgi:ATP-dependent DNA ligase
VPARLFAWVGANRLPFMHRLKTSQQQHGCTWLQHARRPVAALPIGAAVLDGEAVTFNREGQADFAAL